MIGLVLEGGGAKGSYHIGAYKALVENEISFNAITGTSIGAINGAIIAQGEWEKAYELWSKIDMETLFDCEKDILDELSKLSFEWNHLFNAGIKMRKIFKNGGIETSKFTNFLSQYLDEEKIRASNVEFGLVTFGLSDFKSAELFVDDIPEGKIIDYITASANLPAFKNIKKDGKYYTDGGVYNNLPVNMLIEKGYKDIYIIRVFGTGRVKSFSEDGLNITYISPKEKLCNTLEFTNIKSKYQLKLGYYDALKAINNYIGEKYYLINDVDEDYFLNLILNINESKIIEVGKLFGLSQDIPLKRMLFEILIPSIAKLLDVKQTDDYSVIIIRIIEYAAMHLGMERFKIYKYKEFHNSILKKRDVLNKSKFELDSILIDILKIFGDKGIITKKQKKQVMKKIFSIIFA